MCYFNMIAIKAIIQESRADEESTPNSKGGTPSFQKKITSFSKNEKFAQRDLDFHNETDF